MQGPEYFNYNTSLSDIDRRGLYDFLMQLSMQSGANRYYDMNDYDMAGAYLSGAQPGENAHFTDEFKKPNHPTFSTESKYNGADGKYGGQWSENDGQTSFKPSQWNIQNMGLPALQDYFDKVEPDAKLDVPQISDVFKKTMNDLVGRMMLGFGV